MSANSYTDNLLFNKVFNLLSSVIPAKKLTISSHLLITLSVSVPVIV
nr:MAG TPA: hypothetical protein [Bacteriophage sp.]